MEFKEKSPKVLVGGIPLGTNNIGDEAIAAAVVSIIQEISPNAQITVSTESEKLTTQKLGVNTCPLIGFSSSKSGEALMNKKLMENDIFIWSGATGLSDYPHIPLNIINAAHSLGKKTVVYCVGMDSKLNPIHFSILPGKKRKMLEIFSRITLNKINFIKFLEEKKVRDLKRELLKTFAKTDLIVLRDEQSKSQVGGDGKSFPIIVAADPAILTKVTPIEKLLISNDVRDVLKSNKKKIGICISAQGVPKGMDKFHSFLDGIIERENGLIFFIPMNPITDANLMSECQSKMKHREETFIVDQLLEPEDVAGFAGEMDLIISSRLHLLILSSISHVPLIGIERIGKIANFLSAYGQPSLSNIDEENYPRLIKMISHHLQHKNEFIEVSKRVREEMLERLDNSKKHFSKVLG